MNGNNNDDDEFVRVGMFDQYKSSQETLCETHRTHLGAEILNMKESIRWSVYITGAVITIVLSVLNWYFNVVK